MCKEEFEKYLYIGVVATGLVSPVLAGPLFHSLMACLVPPISTIAHWIPTQGQHTYTLHTLAGDVPHAE